MLAQVALVSGQAISNANSQQLGSSICRYVIHPAAALLLLLLLAPAHKTHVTTNTPPSNRTFARHQGAATRKRWGDGTTECSQVQPPPAAAAPGRRQQSPCLQVWRGAAVWLLVDVS